MQESNAPGTDETVAAIAGLYLGNILYALEACALGLDQQGQGEHAAFYRGIARKLAEARGREKGAG
ncbi:MAG TPA: hypothetical protein VFV33_02860 [Gemmatimonadaceae bacterium]|nr:hypothetical protein [Gemmatimonadaceae bacterium]